MHQDRWAKESRTGYALGLALLTLSLFGCGDKTEVAPNPATPENTNPLRVLVVGQASASESIRRFWNAEATTPVETSDVSEESFEADPKAAMNSFDVVVYPSHLSARLAAESLLLPLNADQLEDSDWNASDVLAWEKSAIVRWGKETIGISLGHRPWVLAYRSDLLEAAGETVPTTWEEYQELAARLQAAPPAGAVVSSEDPWTAVVEPTASPWNAHLLLARAGAGIRHRGAYSGLFDLGQTDPLIAGEPYVLAMNSIVSVNLHSGTRRFTPEECFARVASGRAALAVLPIPTVANWQAWQSLEASRLESANKPAEESSEGPIFDSTEDSANGPSPTSSEVVEGLRFAQLPVSARVFVSQDGKWRAREDDESRLVPYLGGPGTLVSIVKSTRRSGTAWGFVRWLGSKGTQTRLGGVFLDSFPTRFSTLSSLDRWLPTQLGSSGIDDLNQLIREIHQEPTSMFPPRYSDERAFLKALEQAVERCMEQVEAKVSLETASEDWKTLIHHRDPAIFVREHEAGLGL